MEAVVAHAPGVNDEPALRRLQLLFAVIRHHRACACHWKVADLWWLRNIERVSPAVISHENQSPVIESTFPKLAEVDRHFNLVAFSPDDVAWLNLVPGENRAVNLFKRRRSLQPEKDLVFKVWHVLSLHGQADLEVLPDAAHDWGKRVGKLPINSIVEHVQDNHGLVSDLDILVAQKLDQDALNPVQLLLVLLDLRYEKSPLKFLDQLDFLHRLPPTELFNKSSVVCLAKRILLDHVCDLLGLLGELCQPCLVSRGLL